ncbi:MAG TPA: phage holin family protein [Candidatus Saccharimonadales bacterium]|nr:phage holin family protein [Candidatus Saccharimonadales bacterium]
MAKRKKQPFIVKLLLRWVVSGLGLWIAASLLKHGISYGNSFGVLAAAGLLLAVINTFLKPFLIVLSLPALIFSLGLFMIIINGLTVYIVSRIYSHLTITNFWAATFAGIVIGLVNYLVTTILEGI